MNYLLYIPLIIVCYFIGSTSMAHLIGRLKGFDLREKGSGNLGATNATIEISLKAGVITGLYDIGKAVLCCLLAKYLLSALIPFAVQTAGASVILGHIFPFYLGFRGGKGLSCMVGMTLALDWRLFLAAVLSVILITVILDHIAFATIFLAIGIPIADGVIEMSWIAFAILALPSAVIIIKHFDNVRRIIDGTEHGLKELIFKPKSGNDGPTEK